MDAYYQNKKLRRKQLKQDYDEVCQILEQRKSSIDLKWVLFDPLIGDSDPVGYRFEINVRLVIGLTWNGVPKYKSKFLLEVKLPPMYPEGSLPHLKITPAPFHPFVRRLYHLPLFWQENYGIWMEPSSYTGSLGTYIIRVLKSLRYENIEKHPLYSNYKALVWYSSCLPQPGNTAAQSLFPTDQSPLPTVSDPNTTPSEEGPKKRHFIIDNELANELERQPVKGQVWEPVKGLEKKSPKESAREPEKNLEVGQKPSFQIAPRKPFEIIETKPGYEPELGIKPDFPIIHRSDNRSKRIEHELYIHPKAFRNLRLHIGWGSKTQANQVEQGGLLLGKVIWDKKGRYYGIVEEVIPGDTANGSAAYLEMNHETWRRMVEQADQLPEKELDNKSVIIGWYHTHPNSLDVFMSWTDEATQRHIFSQDWQFAIVLNPHKKIWRAFRGEHSEECQGYVIAGSNTTNDDTSNKT